MKSRNEKEQNKTTPFPNLKVSPIYKCILTIFRLIILVCWFLKIKLLNTSVPLFSLSFFGVTVVSIRILLSRGTFFGNEDKNNVQ